jgi:hypothetical protein
VTPFEPIANWAIVDGTRSVDRVRERTAQAKARWESAEADSKAAYNSYNKLLQRGASSRDAVACLRSKRNMRRRTIFPLSILGD